MIFDVVLDLCIYLLVENLPASVLVLVTLLLSTTNTGEIQTAFSPKSL